MNTFDDDFPTNPDEAFQKALERHSESISPASIRAGERATSALHELQVEGNKDDLDYVLEKADQKVNNDKLMAEARAASNHSTFRDDPGYTKSIK